MRSKINGRTYNTETAKLIQRRENGISITEGGFERETLYRSRTGRYFLRAVGGPHSRHADTSMFSPMWGDRIIALSEAEAQAWAAENGV